MNDDPLSEANPSPIQLAAIGRLAASLLGFLKRHNAAPSPNTAAELLRYYGRLRSKMVESGLDGSVAYQLPSPYCYSIRELRDFSRGFHSELGIQLEGERISSSQPDLWISPVNARLLAMLENAVASLPDMSNADNISGQTIVDSERPKKYLLSWREILGALELKNNTESKNRVRRMNVQHPGPIPVSGQGKQPRVEKGKLLEWWNGLEDRFEESSAKQADEAATVEGRYSHGRDGVVVPGIAGAVKKGRGRQSPPTS
jgi:hypothetical protein